MEPTPADAVRFAAAIAAIDAANARDPNMLDTPAGPRPRELVHGEMMTAWVERLRPDADQALRLAARAHHIRRWEVPRATYPAGRGGYLRWRTDMHAFHARIAAEILRAKGFSEDTVARVDALLHKRGLGKDADVDTMEDALSLVFLETQLAGFAARTERDRLLNILRRTWSKMTPAGRDAALGLAFAPEERALVEAALAAEAGR